MDVIVYPLSGYVNRLQAIASAALVAERLEARLRVCWESTSVAPASAELVFDPEFIERHVLSPDDARQLLAIDFESIPIGLTVDAQTERISVRGHLLGEQHFMPELQLALNAHSEFRQLVFVAGGKFWLDGAAQLDPASASGFRERRARFYRSMRLHPDVERTAANQIESHHPFAALHLRYTDRNHQAPTRRHIREALQEVVARTGVQTLFVASDLPRERERWRSSAQELGFNPWSVPGATLERSDARGAHAALIDWRVLGGAEALVYFSESSFAEEAAVASGHFEESIGLAPSRGRATAVSALGWARAAVTYPTRRWRR